MFKQKLNQYIELIEKYLDRLPWNGDDISQSMRYSLIGGGKRIRPVLALACAETLGADPYEILPAAAALELIHTYSLIHDDLPAMDNDDYRRGQLANHKVFGEAQALLAGDALLTYAFELLAEPLAVPASRQLWAIREVASAAGYLGMVGGQTADLAGEGKALTLAEIESIHRRKTGALLVASARLGGILGGGSEQEIEILTDYATALGLAFQIKDDILDIEGDTVVLGKPSGSDVRLGKATYPALMGLDGAKEYLNTQIGRAQAALQALGKPAAFLFQIAEYIEKRQY